MFFVYPNHTQPLIPALTYWIQTFSFKIQKINFIFKINFYINIKNVVFLSAFIFIFVFIFIERFAFRKLWNLMNAPSCPAPSPTPHVISTSSRRDVFYARACRLKSAPLCVAHNGTPRLSNICLLSRDSRHPLLQGACCPLDCRARYSSRDREKIQVWTFRWTGKLDKNARASGDTKGAKGRNTQILFVN